MIEGAPPPETPQPDPEGPARATAAAPEPAARRFRLDWRILPPLVVTVVVMLVLVRRLAGPEAFFAALAGADWSLLLAAVALVAANLWLAAQRWIVVLAAMGIRLSLARALEAMLATWPLALLTPGRASDVLRGVAIRDVAPVLVGTGSVLAERAIDLQSLCLITLVGGAMVGVRSAVVLAAVLLALEWAVIVLVVRRADLVLRLPLLRRRPAQVEQLLLAFGALLRAPRRLLVAALLSLSSWAAAVAMLQTLLWMTHAEVDPLRTLALWPAAVLAGMVPITLAGMGTRDGAFVYLLGATGYRPILEGPLLAATFGYAVLGTLLFAIAGIPFTVRFVLRLSRAG
ncbi:MAG: flippase-like domain-containing protein [Deltaproteobacteria bacterium]|nr:flippase-like domain-containing protein [Deltaproteobacteria bacterium]MBK8237634.1 flippase-like domain-containing protein [Deltaproteobacteria bacterium]MBK8719492.1 flippase-like domain-containing protein [Deltaproteobacteria bacterium]MBP7287549.1 flippase-like domain-containing protein [Nannocystaceae bacterium]